VAAALDMSDTVLGFFLKSYTFCSYNNRNIKKSLPASVLLYNNHDNQSESLFLRILVSWGRITTFVSLIEGCRGNWSMRNILDAAEVMIAREDWDFLERLLDLSTTLDLLKNASNDQRLAFHQVFQHLQHSESGGNQIYQQYT
jgi:hypothetical protein